MEAAKEVLVEGQQAYTTKSLVAKLIQDGKLGPPVNPQKFLAAFRRYLQRKGTPLTVNSTGTKFLLTEGDKKLRIKFAQQMLTLLKMHSKDGVLKCVFVDETTLEESPHPKAGM
jgi:hypothetical protein